MARLATVSSIGVPIKMMLSRSRREKISYARSPRLVCSITIGTRAMIAPSLCCYRYKPNSTACGADGGGKLGRFPVVEELQRFLVPHPVFDAFQSTVAGQSCADRLRSLLGLLGQGVDLFLDFVVRDLELFLFRDLLEDERRLHLTDGAFALSGTQTRHVHLSHVFGAHT